MITVQVAKHVVCSSLYVQKLEWALMGKTHNQVHHHPKPYLDKEISLQKKQNKKMSLHLPSSTIVVPKERKLL